MLTFTVYGVAQPKGNMKAYVRRGMKFPIVTERNPGVRSWSQLVAEGASRALAGCPPEERQLSGAVRVTVAFYLPRPKRLQKRGIAAAHLTAPDVDKLARAVLDALTAVAFPDDAHVTELIAAKLYADVHDAPHATICVSPTAGTRVPMFAEAAPLPLFG